jgi:hypothetical protein
MEASVEAVFEKMPRFIEDALRWRADLVTANPGCSTPEADAEEARTTIVAAAYSRTQGRILARVWNGYEDPKYAVVDIEPGRAYVQPTLDGVVPLTPQDMEAAARRQVAEYGELARANGSGLGGALILADVTERGINVRELCNLDAVPAAAPPRHRKSPRATLQW